jgi:hypothetical protein
MFIRASQLISQTLKDFSEIESCGLPNDVVKEAGVCIKIL